MHCFSMEIKLVLVEFLFKGTVCSKKGPIIPHNSP